MNKVEEKKVSQNTNEQKLLEKEFHKTTFGKFVKIIVIVAMVAIAIGLVLGIFEAIVYARNLDINKYQTIIDLGEICFDCGGSSIFFCMLFYACLLPALMKEKEHKLNKKSTTFILVLYTLCMGTPILKMLSEICELIW